MGPYDGMSGLVRRGRDWTSRSAMWGSARRQPSASPQGVSPGPALWSQTACFQTHETDMFPLQAAQPMVLGCSSSSAETELSL